MLQNAAAFLELSNSYEKIFLEAHVNQKQTKKGILKHYKTFLVSTRILLSFSSKGVTHFLVHMLPHCLYFQGQGL